MVFKRVLKGIGRLMLTTAVMCGVGLFLCSSEVKAANSPTISIERDSANKEFKIYLIPDPTDKDINPGDVLYNLDTGRNVELVNNSNSLCTIDLIKSEIKKVNASGTGDSTPVLIASISDSDFLTKVNESGNINNLTVGSGTTVKPKVYLQGGATELSEESGKGTEESAPIYKVNVTNDTAYIDVAFKPDYKYKVNGRNMPYGYEGEEYTVTPSQENYNLENYYSLIRKQSDTGSLGPTDQNWKSAELNLIKGKISNTEENNKLKVAYLPKINDFKINTATPGTLNNTGNRLDIVVGATDTAQLNVNYGINSLKQSNESYNDLTKYDCYVDIVQENLTITDTDFSVPGVLKANIKLTNPTKSGYAKVTINSMLNNTIVNSSPLELEIYVGVEPTGIVFKNVPITIMAAGNEEQVPIVSGFSPSGANQDPKLYTLVSINETSTPKLLETLGYDQASGAVKVKANSTAAGGKTTKVILKLNDGNGNLVQGEFEVKIISFDKEKTISSINKNNKNYITYNKDKGYSLDIKQLIIDNAKDTSDNAVTITKDQITEVYVGSSSCSDGIWKPSEAALNKKVTCKINSTAISSDSFTVSAYPMPTATYSSSNRTLSVKIPTKVATAYSDDNNIRQSKGFKLILEDSSGNTLYEYTDSKYQNVLSSSSESTVTYTVTAADIEGMITSAASNGKFSADTTSVKFKVIPMGYKQSSTSDETIKAKDEIAGKTDAVTVYKVSASGTNFTSSAAYGLDGQTVSITATPNSGYSFKQWSDGNTSNPRQVKVSASGTRAFQAVAGDRVANSTGAGGTDNSELYDDVPKTAESNSAIWLIVFMVFAVMGTTYALYLQLRAANSKHDR